MVPAWVTERVDAKSWEPAGGGYTASGRWRVVLADGSRAFVKAADAGGALAMLVREMEVYTYIGLTSHGFVPEVRQLLHADAGAVLVLEDLSDAVWPPPYPEDTSPLFEALEGVAAAAPPPGLPCFGERESRWARVAADPAPLLGLDVCSAEWLERALPVLRQAEDGALTTGDRLVHRDVWAGNLCFAARGAVLVDWGSAGIGNPQLDLAMALLSIRAEGGRAPRLDFPEESAFAALLAGHNAVEAVAPLPAWASPDATLRADQLGDLRHALPWVAELLGLPPPA